MTAFDAESEHCRVDRDGHLIVVTLNRPAARNALTPQMLERMLSVWEEANADDQVRACVLTGAGGTFCSGADLASLSGGDDAPARPDQQMAHRAMLRTFFLEKPLVVAVEGVAVGGGTELTLASDIRVAGSGARFGLPEVRWGLFPLAGGTVRLPRQIPFAQATAMLLTGRLVNAEEALAMGLLTEVVAKGAALDRALEIAATIAANGPLAVKAVKRSLWQSSGMAESEALERELAIGRPVFETADAKEGPAAFLARRTPDFNAR
jgi:enoyl-CoA hydratase